MDQSAEVVAVRAGLVPVEVVNKAYYVSGQVITDCNSILFINYGSEPVTIDAAIILQQNQSWGVDGNAGEIMTQQFTAIFGTGGGTQSLVVTRKVFKSVQST
jgi:hypothetical protein